MNNNEMIKFLKERIKRLNEIGLALSKEDDTNVIFEMILEEAKNITHADGRTLYMKNADGNLKFEILRNDSKNTVMGGTSGVDIPFPPVKLVGEDGEPNEKNVSAYAAIHSKTINIKDAYEEEGFDFSGAKNYDKNFDYRSKSFLTVPLIDHENEVIGVMQLINATNPETNETIDFSQEMQEQVESLASQGAVALTNKKLVAELKNLFESFIKLIATAIDKKSPYTGGHCERVPEITMMLADAVENVDYGTYKNFSMTEDERYELFIAGWLHDCGKVATPPNIVDKGTKLEKIVDRIDMVNSRFEIVKRDFDIELLKSKINESQYKQKIEQLQDDKEFVNNANVGGEFMKEEDQQRIIDISTRYRYELDGKIVDFFDDDETKNLQIPKGTLLPYEREIINSHIVITIDMLEKLPYPKKLKNVPEFAGGHHEKLDGTGYPKGLKADEMSVQAKMMAIADIYEALTAADRPYKDGKKLSDAMRIMGFMKKDYEIDEELFEIFVKEGVYKRYAEKYVEKNQIDAVDESKVLA